MFEKKILLVKLVFYNIKIYWEIIHRALFAAFYARICNLPFNRDEDSLNKSDMEEGEQKRNIVIVGASFAGFSAARIITTSLPPSSPYRIVIIEPHSHFHFTWVLPRFCVVPGHEQKAFIPYNKYLADVPAGRVLWVQDRVEAVGEKRLRLRSGDEGVPYDFLLIATGSDVAQSGLDGLPSRVEANTKQEAMELLRGMQERIKNTQNLIVVGGGAAGVELATDTKQTYPDKKIVLVHSRAAVMHRFGPELQVAALKALKDLGVEVILGERVSSKASENGYVTLSSGRKIECDFLVNCAGQIPASQILAQLSPGSITPSGHIRVKSTLQVLDDNLPNVFACGDVTDIGTSNPNSRVAMRQAMIAADNIVLAAKGKKFRYSYKPHWAEAVIKLTLGLHKSVTHFGNGKTELLFSESETDPALMSAGSWRHWGVEPFKDDPEMEYSVKEDRVESKVAK